MPERKTFKRAVRVRSFRLTLFNQAELCFQETLAYHVDALSVVMLGCFHTVFFSLQKKKKETAHVFCFADIQK